MALATVTLGGGRHTSVAVLSVVQASAKQLAPRLRMVVGVVGEVRIAGLTFHGHVDADRFSHPTRTTNRGPRGSLYEENTDCAHGLGTRSNERPHHHGIMRRMLSFLSPSS